MSTGYIDTTSATLSTPNNNPVPSKHPENVSLNSHGRPLASSITLDWHLLALSLGLLSIGFIMVASSSMEYAVGLYSDPWFFTKRHAIYLFIGLIAGLFMLSIPTYLWHKYMFHHR